MTSEKSINNFLPNSTHYELGTDVLLSSAEGDPMPGNFQTEMNDLLETGQVHEALCNWMKCLVLPGPAQVKLPVQDNYFQTLLNAFLQSKYSNHQKFCLAILRASIERLEDESINIELVGYEPSRRTEYRRAYEEYCNLFEIIVMGRYINQIQECMELLPLAKEGKRSLVRPVWWLLLFRAGMESNNEQIRKILGTWLLENYVVETTSEACVQSVQAAFFDSLLTWATYGQLALKSTVRDGVVVKSKHGDLVSIYCNKQSKKNPEFVEYTYQWLSKRTNTLNQHMTVYVLRGMQQADSSRTICEAAVQIARSTRFNPISRLSTRIYCLRVIEKYLVSGDPQDETLKRESTGLKTINQSSRDPINGDLGPFLLANLGTYINHDLILDRMINEGYAEKHELEITIDWDRLTRYDLHQSLWKRFAESWPFWIASAFEHPSDKAATDFSASCISHFAFLSRGRTYLWNTTAKVLRRLSFENTALIQHPAIEAVVLNYFNDPPQPSREYLLDVAVAADEIDDDGGPLYSFLANQSLGHASMFDMLSRLRTQDQAWGQRLLDKILDPWRKQAEPIPMTSKWKRVSQLQAMIILLHSCVHSKDDVEKYYQIIISLLSKEPNPRNRFLMEWAVLYLASQPSFAQAYTDSTLKALEDADPSNPNPKHVASGIKIAVQLVLHAHSADRAESARRCERLLIILVTLIGSSRVPIRFAAQASFPAVFDYARENDLLDIMGCAPAFQSVYHFVTNLDKYKSPPESRILGTFNMNKDMNLATLVEGGYLYMSQIETPLLTARDLQEVQDTDPADLKARRPEPHLPIGTIEASAGEIIAKLTVPKAISESEPSSEINTIAVTTSAPLQTKSLAPDLSLLGLETNTTERIFKHGSGPILIGSLLDAAVNLGGLSRAANVFGCHTLHLPSLAMLENTQFKNVSVSSEEHLEVRETTPSGLLSRLRELKDDGWTIVGLEQTSDSTVIGEPDNSGTKKLPKKAAIVMGTESTGIPADILFECDACIEIKQWGVVRSLNVQTAAACILFEWRREWGDGSSAS